MKAAKGDMPTTTICLINQKGGCGKSSTAFHLGGYFSSIGLNTLLVDADPQGSLSQGFFGSASVENLPPTETLAAVFAEDAYYGATDALVTPTDFERISIVRSNQSLARHNIPQPERGGLIQFMLKEYLRSIRGYDLALIDCPPNLYQCSWASMLAADYVLIPAPAEDFGVQGLRVVHQAIDNAKTLNPSLRLLGHVVTRVDQRLLIHRSYEQKLRMLYGKDILATIIPEASAFKVALACRTPVTQYSSKSKAAGLLALLGDEILSRTAFSAERRRHA